MKRLLFTMAFMALIVTLALPITARAEMKLWGYIYKGGTYNPLPGAEIELNGQYKPGNTWRPFNIKTRSNAQGRFDITIFVPMKWNVKFCARMEGYNENCLYNHTVHEGENTLSVWLQPK